MRKATTFLTKFPISIREKKHSKVHSEKGTIKHYEEKPSRKFDSRYGYFAVDKAGSVRFIIILVDKDNKINYKINIAKQHIYDSLLLFLQYRPIQRASKANKEFFVHKNIKLDDIYGEFSKLTPFQIRKRFEKAKTGLNDIINDESNEVRKRTAELQLKRLLDQNWKMELIYDIYLSEKLVDES